MKDRKAKKRNKKFILNNILSKIEKVFSIKDVRFGSGYFIFTYASASICHFHLKELPHWKCGIWLSQDQKKPLTYDIFAQIEICIDKFKPYASEICFNNVDEFIEEMKKIKNNGGFDTKENEEYYHEELENLEKARIVNLENYSKVYNAIKKFNKENEEIAKLEIDDHNTGCWRSSPRYHFRFLVEEELMNEDEMLLEKLKPVTNLLEEIDEKYHMDKCNFWHKVDSFEWSDLRFP
jgi:hypothetical protein